MTPYQFCEGLTDTGVGAAEDVVARGSKPYPEACTSSTHCANQTTAVEPKLLILISSLLHPQPNVKFAQSELSAPKVDAQRCSHKVIAAVVVSFPNLHTIALNNPQRMSQGKIQKEDIPGVAVGRGNVSIPSILQTPPLISTREWTHAVIILSPISARRIRYLRWHSPSSTD